MKDLVLKNGLKVYVNPKAIGESAVYVGINSGSWQDTIPELAHTTEHVAGVAAKVYGERGSLNYACSNAQTNPTRTAYYFEDMLPQHVTPAVNNLVKVFSPPDISVLDREKDAVRHELKPYRHPLIQFSQDAARRLFPVYVGKRMPTVQERLESLERITPDDILKFWNEHYTTHNAFVYVAGELPSSLDDILGVLEQIPARSFVPEKEKFEPEQALTGRVELKEQLREDGVASIEIAYQAPSFPRSCTLREKVAIELLTAYLSADHGQLYRKMRDEKRLCYNLGVQYNSEIPFISALFFSAMTQPESYEEVEKEWKNVIERIAKEGVGNETLETFKNKAQIRAIHRSRGCDVGSVILKIEDDITREDAYQEVRNLTTQDVVKAAQTFAEKPYIVSITLPKVTS